jgi:predicted RNase H-like HicB family nuclease
MKKTVTYKGNIFTYTLHNISNEGNGEKGYLGFFVDPFKGCMASGKTIPQLEKNLRIAIETWLKPIALLNEERRRLESLERLVRSKDYFYKAMAENVSEEYVENGFNEWWHDRTNQENLLNMPVYDCGKAFKAGIQYALRTPNTTKEITPELMEERFNAWYSEQLKSDIAFLNNPYYECNEAWHASYQYALKTTTEGE